MRNGTNSVEWCVQWYAESLGATFDSRKENKLACHRSDSTDHPTDDWSSAQSESILNNSSLKFLHVMELGRLSIMTTTGCRCDAPLWCCGIHCDGTATVIQLPTILHHSNSTYTGEPIFFFQKWFDDLEHDTRRSSLKHYCFETLYIIRPTGKRLKIKARNLKYFQK